MGLLESFEESHTEQFLAVEHIKIPSATVKTSDGEPRAIYDIVCGHRIRISDHWAWLLLDYWVGTDKLLVREVPMAFPLLSHDPTDNGWAFIEREYGPGHREGPQPLLGRADFTGRGRELPDGRHHPLFVEFGNCAPAKFVLNVTHEVADYMIVPYGSKFAFVFLPTEDLIWAVAEKRMP